MKCDGAGRREILEKLKRSISCASNTPRKRNSSELQAIAHNDNDDNNNDVDNNDDDNNDNNDDDYNNNNDKNVNEIDNKAVNRNGTIFSKRSLPIHIQV